MLSRRAMLIALLPAALRCQGPWGDVWASLAGGGKRVAVVFPAAPEPCTEAVEGLRQSLSGRGITLDLLDLNNATFGAEADREMTRKPAVIVAVGSQALAAVLERQSPARTISTMTLAADRPDGPGPGRVTAAVYLDIPIHTLVAELRRIFPERPRIGIIRNPGRHGEPQVRGQAAETGSPQIADCAAPDELLRVFLSFRKKVDFVICLPDGSLYNAATARPLVMASLENRLPIVGFSPAFLRAGAAVAVYPDYRGIGRQTADLVCRCLEPGDCACWETPRRVAVAVNAKVLRLLGIKVQAAANPDLVILR